MAIVSMRALLETGVHFGHHTQRWHPKMKSFIFTERNGIHIIDLQQTIARLGEAYNVVRDLVAEGGSVLFVGTKRQAAPAIAEQAARCGMPYVNQRWLGGTLTNWRTIRQRIDKLHELEARRDLGAFDQLTKREALSIERQINNMNVRFGGIKDMTMLPDLLYVVDIRREKIAVDEANKLGIPVVAVVDTNCDPTPIDYIIPANDDAIRAVKLITTKIADAVLGCWKASSSARKQRSSWQRRRKRIDSTWERPLWPRSSRVCCSSMPRLSMRSSTRTKTRASRTGRSSSSTKRMSGTTPRTSSAAAPM